MSRTIFPPPRKLGLWKVDESDAERMVCKSDVSLCHSPALLNVVETNFSELFLNHKPAGGVCTPSGIPR